MHGTITVTTLPDNGEGFALDSEAGNEVYVFSNTETPPSEPPFVVNIYDPSTLLTEDAVAQKITDKINGASTLCTASREGNVVTLETTETVTLSVDSKALEITPFS